MENTQIIPTYHVVVEFDWHYPSQPVNTVVKEGIIQTASTDVGQAFIDSFKENYEIGVCTTSNFVVTKTERVFTFEEWIEKYNPVDNEISGSNSFEGYAFDYCNDCGDPECVACMEWEFVKQQDPKCVWTVLSEDDEEYAIYSGFHWINRFCYFVTNKPVEDEDVSKPYIVIE